MNPTPERPCSPAPREPADPLLDLVRRARAGDRLAANALYTALYPTVARRIAHLCGPDAPRADLVQETFERALRGLARYREQGPFTHWLLRIAANVTRSYFRRGRGRVWALWERAEQQDQVPAPLPSVDLAYPRLEAVHRALARLPHRQREAVVLFELEGLRLAEVAAQLQVPLHTAASRVRRGRSRLRQILQGMGYAPGMGAAIPLCSGESP